eukprot:218451_1
MNPYGFHFDMKEEALHNQRAPKKEDQLFRSETGKEWMKKHKQLQNEFRNADQMNKNMEMKHQQNLSRIKEERHEKLLKLRNLEIKKLKNVINEQKDRINHIQAELKELQKNYQLREEWKSHTEMCPLLNSEIRFREEQERKTGEEIMRLKPQLDESLDKMSTENKSLKEKIEKKNVEIDKLRRAIFADAPSQIENKQNKELMEEKNKMLQNQLKEKNIKQRNDLRENKQMMKNEEKQKEIEYQRIKSQESIKEIKQLQMEEKINCAEHEE